MPDVISVENLCKSYRLCQISTGTFSRDLEVWWVRTRGKPNPLLKIGQEDHSSCAGETIWALKDVTFEVEQGEVLGIIGTGTLTRDVPGNGLMDGYPWQDNLL